MALGAIPLYLLARDVLRSRGVAVAVAASFLLYPAVQWIVQANFHPEALAITPMLFAWWFGYCQRWRAFFVALALCARDPRGSGPRCRGDGGRPGLPLAAPASSVPVEGRRAGWRAAWERCCSERAGSSAPLGLLIPHFNAGAGPFYVQYFFGQWGTTIPEVIWNMGTQPQRS